MLALTKKKDPVESEARLLEAIACYEWAGASLDKCGVGAIRRDIDFFNLRRRADDMLERAFDVAQGHETQRALGLLEDARRMYTEAGSAKQVADMTCVENCLRADLTLDTVEGLFGSREAKPLTSAVAAGGGGGSELTNVSSAAADILEEARQVYQATAMLRASGLRMWIGQASAKVEQIAQLHAFIMGWRDFELAIEANAGTARKVRVSRLRAERRDGAARNERAPRSLAREEWAPRSLVREEWAPQPLARNEWASLSTTGA